jgi:nucleotide-binding universal stress UspA family protein
MALPEVSAVHMPTLPARTGSGYKPVFGRILFPVDGSLSMTPLVHACLAFAAGIGAEVVAVHVVAPATATAALAHAARILQDVAGTARTLGVPCECRVLTGAEPWQQIVRAALDYHADLICMGSHGRHGASEHILASQAARVIEHSRLPVLLYR